MLVYPFFLKKRGNWVFFLPFTKNLAWRQGFWARWSILGIHPRRPMTDRMRRKKASYTTLHSISKKHTHTHALHSSVQVWRGHIEISCTTSSIYLSTNGGHAFLKNKWTGWVQFARPHHATSIDKVAVNQLTRQQTTMDPASYSPIQWANRRLRKATRL